MKRGGAIAILASAALFAGGCDEATTAPPSAPAATAVSTAVKVSVELDDMPLTIEVTAKARSLRDVLPAEGRDPKKWRELHARSVDGKRTLGLSHFAEKYASHDVRLFVDAAGRPCVGVFRELDDAMPAHVRSKLSEPHIVLVDVATVRVRTTETKETTEPALAPLKVSFDTSQLELSSSRLGALSEALAPSAGDGRARPKGWRLDAVVGLVADLDRVASVIVRGDGDSVRVPGESLAASVGLFRYNRRGELSFVLWDAAAPRRLRAVTELVVASK